MVKGYLNLNEYLSYIHTMNCIKITKIYKNYTNYSTILYIIWQDRIRNFNRYIRLFCTTWE
jgi:hypothetical protein